MLSELAVRNLGVVSDLHLAFGPGMTALTGETGAGKTMIVEALALLSGGRADPGMVRQGTHEATIEGRFVRGDHEIVVTRVVPAQGRSRAYVNGDMATVASLTALMQDQVDLHAQHAHQSLRTMTGQRAALDRFAQVDLAPLVEIRERIRIIEAELRELGGDPASRDRELDLLEFQVSELDEAALSDPGEDDELAREQLTLGDVASHRELGESVLARLGDDGGAIDLVGEALHQLASSDLYGDLRARLEGLSAELGDVVVELRGVVESVVDDPVRLAEVTERRQQLARLRRRFGYGTLGEVIDEHRRLRDRLDQLSDSEGRIATLTSALEEQRALQTEAQAVVGKARREAAGRFARAVERELRLLAMPSAAFTVEVSDDDPGDEVAMCFSANPGMSPSALAKTASGGELARAMLAIRLIATSDQDTVVFDEVDAGIGGTAADAVGAALARVAQQRQVLVVTHLAQVAAAASTQIGVTKSTIEGVTHMRAEVLAGDGRVVELSRMLSGRTSSEAARAHARELLDADQRLVDDE